MSDRLEIGKDNPPILAPLNKLAKCKHGVYGLCTQCAYKNTGRRQSTDAIADIDVVDKMNLPFNKRLKISYDHF